MKTIEVYGGICSGTHWYANVLGNQFKVAWLFLPIQDYEAMLEPLLIRGTERLYEFLNIDVRDSKGKPNPQLIRSVMDAIKLVESRLHGSPTQRLESKNLNLSASMNPNPYSGMTIEETDRRLAELRESSSPNLLDGAHDVAAANIHSGHPLINLKNQKRE